jgi:hypothetical protein
MPGLRIKPVDELVHTILHLSANAVQSS